MRYRLFDEIHEVIVLKIIFRNAATLKINRKNFVWKKLWRDTAPLQGFFMSGFRKSTAR